MLESLVCLFFKQKTAYEMRISDWSSDVCSSDLGLAQGDGSVQISANGRKDEIAAMASAVEVFRGNAIERKRLEAKQEADLAEKEQRVKAMDKLIRGFDEQITAVLNTRSEEHRLNSSH